MIARHRPVAWFAALVALAATGTPLLAQTNDQARLTVGVSAGYISSLQLWDVPNQPIQSTFELGDPSIWHLDREIRSDISISGHATYFPSPHFGYTGEFTYLGLGSTDACNVVHDDGDVELVDACDALKGAQRPASVTTIQGGAIVRPLTGTLLQPYFKGMAGLAFTPISTVEMESVYGQIGDTVEQITVYRDPDWKPVRVSFSVGAGIATAPSRGYQIRAEVRETWLPLSTVAGPVTVGQGFIPTINSSLKHFTSVMVSFDVVLEQRRGRRY